VAELRERKKRETRTKISDAATRLFYARGFDSVTIEEIAAAADVSKVTVFNYFVRKEDLFFDREPELERLLHDALVGRPQQQSALDALRQLVERLRQQQHPFAHIDATTVGFFRIVAGSPALQARLREIEDEAADMLAAVLGGPKPDGLARLLAGMVVVTWRTAYAEAIRVFERQRSARKANAAFVVLIERGFAAVQSLESA
jgi:AcrR family transcriptional regulator